MSSLRRRGADAARCFGDKKCFHRSLLMIVAAHSVLLPEGVEMAAFALELQMTTMVGYMLPCGLS